MTSTTTRARSRSSSADEHVVTQAAGPGASRRAPNPTRARIANRTSTTARPRRDIRKGSLGSGPQHFALLNGTLLFSADDGKTGAELWKA